MNPSRMFIAALLPDGMSCWAKLRTHVRLPGHADGGSFLQLDWGSDDTAPRSRTIAHGTQRSSLVNQVGSLHEGDRSA
jgi:hypothetical protein